MGVACVNSLWSEMYVRASVVLAARTLRQGPCPSPCPAGQQTICWEGPPPTKLKLPYAGNVFVNSIKYIYLILGSDGEGQE